MMIGRRIRAYLLPAEWFGELRTGTTWEIFEGLPADATVLAVHDDPTRRSILVMAEHPSFSLVPLGEMAPIFSVKIVAKRDDGLTVLTR